jgi:hypothetical protein
MQFPRVGVAGSHLRTLVAEISLHDVERDTVVEQFGGPGVAQPMCLGEPQRATGAVGEVVGLVELFQLGPVGGCRGGAVDRAAGSSARGTVSGLQPRVFRREPALLIGGDVDDGLLGQDGRDDAVDFGLLVAQPRDKRPRVSGLIGVGWRTGSTNSSRQIAGGSISTAGQSISTQPNSSSSPAMAVRPITSGRWTDTAVPTTAGPTDRAPTTCTSPPKIDPGVVGHGTSGPAPPNMSSLRRKRRYWVAPVYGTAWLAG